MALTSGFYNSLNHDRLYNNDQISGIFEGIITDGIFDSIGTAMVVTAVGNMYVGVGVGRAWFDGRWIDNDAIERVLISNPDPVNDRIDTVCLVVDDGAAVRAASFEVLVGVAGSSPVHVDYTTHNTETKHYHPLADILVKNSASVEGDYDIDQAWITNRVGTEDTPFITGIIESIDISTLLQQYEAQFNNWFAAIEDVLDENTAAKLYNMILSNTFDYTLAADSWFKPVGSDHWQYEIRSSTYIWTAGSAVDHPKDSNQEILPQVGISKELLEMLQAANIVDGGQYMDGQQGVMKLICMGDKPTENLPIRIIYRGMK